MSEIDPPPTRKGQFTDKDTRYRTAIFYNDDRQKMAAGLSKKWVGELLINRGNSNPARSRLLPG